MIDSNQETRELIASPNPIEQLKKEIEGANGKPIVLKKNIDGKPLFLQVLSEDYKLKPKGLFDDDWESLHPLRNVTSINILIREDGNFSNIAHYDWVSRYDRKNRKNVAGAVRDAPTLPELEKNDIFQNVFKSRYSSHSTFIVMPDYQGKGIGSFMLATAVVAMDIKGVTEINEGVLLSDAIGVWRNFGVEVVSSGKENPGIREPVSVKKIIKNPHTAKIISEFIELPQKAS